MRSLLKILARARRFGRNERAIAATEFALLLPFMMVLYTGSIELSQAVTVDRKVAIAASSLGDLVAREKGTFPLTRLNDYFAAASSTMRPYDDANLKQVITSVVIDDGMPVVDWSIGYNGGNDHDNDAEFDLPAEMLAIVPENGCVIVAEAQISYQPVIGFFFESPLTLYKEFFYLPRYENCLPEPA